MKSETEKRRMPNRGVFKIAKAPGPLPGPWPSTWTWGGRQRTDPVRRPDIRDLHGDYSEQVGAFFG